jgi:dihydroneopterin aldolase
MSELENDLIEIKGLGVASRMGVPDDERAVAQRLELDVWMWPERGFRDLGDELGGTVDYGVVAERCREVAGERERRLIETLAEEVAEVLLAGWRLRAVRVTVRKFILADCGSVAVTVERGAGSRESR